MAARPPPAVFPMRIKHAVALRREDGSLALFLRVNRAPSGIYVVWAAGQHRPGHDPHSSWHRDGRVHHKSFNREFQRSRRQPLGPGFTGAEYFLQTNVMRGSAGLPTCDPAEFDSVFTVPTVLLGDVPSGSDVYIELLGPGAEPAAPLFEHRLIDRARFNEEIPTIAVSFYDVRLLAAAL